MKTGQDFGAAFEYGREATVVIDDDGRIVAANHFAREGFSLHVIAFVVSMELGAFRQQLITRGSARHELDIIDADGAAHEVVAHGVTLEPGRHMIMFEDVGEVRRLERTLRQAQRLDSRTYVMAAAVHDLKNSLSEILLHGTALDARLSMSPGAEAVELANDMLGASRRAAMLVERMLTGMFRVGEPEEAPRPITHRRRMALATGDETILLFTRDTGIRTTLESAGYFVLDAPSAAAALALAEHHGERIDLFVHDAHSTDVLARVRRFHPSLPTFECGSLSAAELLRAVRSALARNAVAM